MAVDCSNCGAPSDDTSAGALCRFCGTVLPVAPPPAAAAPPPPPPPPAQPVGTAPPAPRANGRLGCLFATVVLLAAGGLAAFLVTGAVSETAGTVAQAVRAPLDPAALASSPAPPPVPRGTLQLSGAVSATNEVYGLPAEACATGGSSRIDVVLTNGNVTTVVSLRLPAGAQGPGSWVLSTGSKGSLTVERVEGGAAPRRWSTSSTSHAAVKRLEDGAVQAAFGNLSAAGGAAAGELSGVFATVCSP